MPLYRRKSSELRAVQFTRDAWTKAKAMNPDDRDADQKLLAKVAHQSGKGFILENSSGTCSIGVNDYVALRGSSEYQVINKDNFEDLYELLGEPEKEVPPPDLKAKAAALLAERQGKEKEETKES